MTECERLVSNGTFSPDFFKPEVRCDFLVDEKRKKIWAVELDLLLQLDRVCRKHGLTYWLGGGSLLGAVRHKGFIPWDDDIDVTMPRTDYDKFLQLAYEFGEPYFLQTPYTDPEFFYAFARLRNSNTLYLSEVFRYQKINHGIPLDIFPLDNHVPGADGESFFNEIAQHIVDNSTFMRMKHPCLDEGNRKRVKEYPGGNPLARYELIQKLCKRDAEKVPEWYWTPTGAPYGYRHCLYRVVDYADKVVCKFEGVDTFIPRGYDGVLKREYGDYMQLPPREKRSPRYGADYFDADISYRDYLKQ